MSDVVDISTMSAVLFVVIASCFLVLLYKLMSTWFMDLLVVLFCIGGVEVCIIPMQCLLVCLISVSSIQLVTYILLISSNKKAISGVLGVFCWAQGSTPFFSICYYKSCKISYVCLNCNFISPQPYSTCHLLLESCKNMNVYLQCYFLNPPT